MLDITKSLIYIDGKERTRELNRCDWIQQLGVMGHTDISVTSNVYTHLKLEDAQREMERMKRIEEEYREVLGG